MDADQDRLQAELGKIEAAIAMQESLRGVLDDEQIETTLVGLKAKQTTIVAQLGQGSAAAIGTDAMAVASRGVGIGGDLIGNVITGDIQGNVYIGKPTDNPARALDIYRTVFVRSHSSLPLRGVDVGASDPTQNKKSLALVHVYIDLDTTARQEEERSQKSERTQEKESKPIPALMAAAQNQRLVLLGDPGGGKSTFVNHLAHCLAAHQLQPDGDWDTRLKNWPKPDTQRLPLVVILRDFAHSLPEPLPAEANACHLWDFIKARLEAQRLGFAAEAIEQELEDGRCLVLLDGLDEVTSDAQRIFVRDAVLAFTARYHPENRYLVTCRVLSYQPPDDPKQAPDLRLPVDIFPFFELAPFDEDKIKHFIGAWYTELARLGSVPSQDVETLAGKFETALKRPDLWRLASNPLLLTVMALIHTHKGRLPDARALLYEDTIDILLWRWEEVKAGGQSDAPRLRQLLLAAERTETDLKKLLWQLAYEAHAQIDGDAHQDALVGINELDLLKALAKLAGDDWNWARQVVAAMKLRAGLLLEREPSVFTFPHRTFQEYMAGAHLTIQRNFAHESVALAETGSAWREVILLAVGRLVYLSGDTERPLGLVERLCPAATKDNETGWRNAWLAGDVLLEMGLKRVQDDEWGKALLARVQQRLADLLTQGHLPPRERVAAGDTLAGLGDPRPGVCSLEPDLITIPAGAFLMGEEKYSIHLDTFDIARTPVTNAQFRMFIEDGGYTEKWQHCWTDDGWKYRQSDGWQEPRYWQDTRFNQANQPVVGISWYETVAYCRWLSEKSGSQYRLPTEAEWERAARHTDGREFPWEKTEPTPETTNWSKTGIERLAAVGCFPQDEAVCGARDMAGNISEWCQTRWQDEKSQKYSQPYQLDDGREELSGDSNVYRVLRGGYWNGDTTWMRCASRGGYNPSHWDYSFGFRVVCVPLSHSDR